MPPLVVTVFSLLNYVSKKVDGLQEGNNARWGAALNLLPKVQYNGFISQQFHLI